MYVHSFPEHRTKRNAYSNSVNLKSRRNYNINNLVSAFVSPWRKAETVGGANNYRNVFNKCRVDNAATSCAISSIRLMSRYSSIAFSPRDDSTSDSGRTWSIVLAVLFVWPRSFYPEFPCFRFFFRATRADCEKNPLRFASSKLASLLDGAHCIGIGTRSPLTLRTDEPSSYISSTDDCSPCSANRPFLPLNRELFRDSTPGYRDVTRLNYSSCRRIATRTSSLMENFIPDICRTISLRAGIIRRWQFDFDPLRWNCLMRIRSSWPWNF